jgi:hypothetical protein
VTEDDKARFHKLVTGVMLNYDKTASDDLLAIWWSQMDGCQFADVERAMIQHMRSEKFAPRLADVLGRMPQTSNAAFPGPEEAWGMCPKDEDVTAWVFPEMISAYVACQWQREAGDMIGARMAFIEAYKRETAYARGLPAWFISDANNTTQEQREQSRMALMDRHPERTTPAQIADQRHILELTNGLSAIGGALLSLASDAAKENREATVEEVRARLKELRLAAGGSE